MPSAYDRSDFTPPPDRGSVLAFGLALMAHALLIAALTWGINWQKTDVSGGYEAEIWSAVPQQAAPRLIEPPPPEPAQPPALPPAPAPAKEPVTQTPPVPAEVDIAQEQEKKRKLLAQQKEAEEEKRAEKQKAQAAAKKEKELKAREDENKRLAAVEAQKLEAQKQAKQREAEKQSQAAVQKQRQEALDRMMGMAGSSGNSASTGSAARSTGPSASYGGRVRARVKPNIVFTDEIVGNPTAEVEVRTTPDGSIISQRLIKPSGNAAWDEAVVKAIIRTGNMPRDVDGTVPSPMILQFKPRDF